MKSKTLNYFVNIIANWNDKSSDIRNELYFLNSSVFLKSIDQFVSELGENTSALNIKKKRERIKVYIQRFKRAVSISQGNEPNRYHSISFDNWIVKNDKKNKDPNPSYTYFEKIVHQLLVMIFNHIQFFCWQNDIPFIEMCEEEGFPTETIDLSISLPDNKRLNFPFHSTFDNVKPKTDTKSEKIIQSEDNSSNSSQFKNLLKEKGFFTLTKVKELPKDAIEKLIGFIIENDVPYQTAMFEYLGFIKHLQKEYFTTKKALCDFLGDLFSTTSRTVKGNINVLDPYSKEDRNRYTADKLIKTVITDYQKLK